MANVVWLAAPYLSMLVICRWTRVAIGVARHAAVTLPVGWLAVAGTLAGVLRLWTPPVPVLVACGALSGLSMITPGGGDDDDGGGGDDGDDPGPGFDWDAFDHARRSWERDRADGGGRAPTGAGCA